MDQVEFKIGGSPIVELVENRMKQAQDQMDAEWARIICSGSFAAPIPARKPTLKNKILAKINDLRYRLSKLIYDEDDRY